MGLDRGLSLCVPCAQKQCSCVGCVDACRSSEDEEDDGGSDGDAGGILLRPGPASGMASMTFGPVRAGMSRFGACFPFSPATPLQNSGSWLDFVRIQNMSNQPPVKTTSELGPTREKHCISPPQVCSST